MVIESASHFIEWLEGVNLVGVIRHKEGMLTDIRSDIAKASSLGANRRVGSLRLMGAECGHSVPHEEQQGLLERTIIKQGELYPVL
jgi:hypothetical protein